jgi:hypothetical protein
MSRHPAPTRAVPEAAQRSCQAPGLAPRTGSDNGFDNLIVPGQEYFHIQARRPATQPCEKPGLGSDVGSQWRIAEFPAQVDGLGEDRRGNLVRREGRPARSCV